VSSGGGRPGRTDEELALLEQVARTIGDFVLVTDVHGNLTYVNEAVLERSGWSREELLGRPWQVFLAPSNPAGTEERIAAATKAGGFRGDLRNVTRSGEEFWVALRTSVLRRDGEVAGFVSISRDIGERKRAEAELTAARDAAEAASRAKTEFLANISHEIRTPMNAVLGMAGLLLDTALTPEQRDYVETIRTSGDTLLTLLNDVLDFSKMESERLELECRPFSFRDAVEDSFDLVAPQAAGKGIDLAYRVDASVPATLLGDVTRVRQVLLNLLTNAVKFTQAGEVVLRATARPKEGRSRVEIVVRDTGIGIPPQRLDRLFRSFSQVDPSTTRQFGGTGLGLAICKRLAEKMGGGISAESTGRGSTFRVEIVAPEGPPLPNEGRVPGLERLAGQRVFVLDDGPGSRETLSETLAGWGMLVRTTGSAREALTWIEAGEAFDIGLVDEEMSEVDGRRFAESIRRFRDADALPLVLVTSRGRRGGGPRGTFAAVVARPLRPRALASVLAGLRDDSVSRKRRRGSSSGLPRDLGTSHPLRILLAEDNAVNQKVALSHLARMGYRADVAATGREALEAVRRERYDVVLMDVQMPEMDGLEATRRVRSFLPDEDGPWIVALTASAMTGDPERCLAAGMNDYLSKPVRAEELAAALRRTPRRTAALAPRGDVAGSLPVLAQGPLEALKDLERPGEDGFLASLLEIFRRDTPQRLDEMERAAASSDAETFRRAAHTLKSSAAALGGARVEALAARIETFATAPATLGEAAALLSPLRSECAALFTALGLADGEGARLTLDTGEYGRS
jgi:PAS domain S-box-containing protein